MELLEKIVKIFKEIPRKLTCGNNFVFAASKALISMQQNSTREKI